LAVVDGSLLGDPESVRSADSNSANGKGRES
jgi:hypothetical protein